MYIYVYVYLYIIYICINKCQLQTSKLIESSGDEIHTAFADTAGSQNQIRGDHPAPSWDDP